MSLATRMAFDSDFRRQFNQEMKAKHQVPSVTLSSEFELRQKVTIDGDSSIVGTVIGFCWRGGVVQIDIAWFSNGVAQSAWFEEWRVSAAPQAQ